MRKAIDKVRAKLADGDLVTGTDVARLERQLSRTPGHAPEYLALARMIATLRGVAVNPLPWWFRSLAYLSALCAIATRPAALVRLVRGK